eukprot:UN31928
MGRTKVRRNEKYFVHLNTHLQHTNINKWMTEESKQPKRKPRTNNNDKKKKDDKK